MSRRPLLILALAGWPACALLWTWNHHESSPTTAGETVAAGLAPALGEPLSADVLESLAEIRESMGSPLLASAGAFEIYSPEPPQTLLPEGVSLADNVAEENQREFVEMVRQAADPAEQEFFFNVRFMR